MARVVALLDAPVGRTRLKSAIRIDRASGAGAGHRLEWAKSGADLLTRANVPPRPLVVLDPYVDRTLNLPLLARLLGQSGALGVIVYASFDARAAQDVVSMAGLGVRWVLTEGVDDAPTAIRQVLIAASRDLALQTLLEDARRLLPGRAFRAFQRILRGSVEPIKVTEVAESLGCASRTLNRILTRADLPTPGLLIRWCRILHAVRLMEDRDRTLEQVAWILGFSDPANLRRLSKSLTLLTPYELVEAGGSAAVRARILSMMTQLPSLRRSTSA